MVWRKMKGQYFMKLNQNCLSANCDDIHCIQYATFKKKNKVSIIIIASKLGFWIVFSANSRLSSSKAIVEVIKLYNKSSESKGLICYISLTREDLDLYGDKNSIANDLVS